MIAAERLGQTAYQTLETIALQSDDSEIAMAVVTEQELAHGIARADTPQRRARLQTMKLDDRQRDEISLDEIGRIAIRPVP